MKSRHRKTVRTTLRRPFRGLNRPCLRGRRQGPDDLSQAFTAYGRAVRAHRRLARLAPRFFDVAVIDREQENRAEQRRWMALWEPILAKAYGVDPQPPSDAVELPPLPPPRIQKAVDRQLAELHFWMAAGHAALERHQQQQPHAIPSLSKLARWLDLALNFKKLALGLDSKNPLPMKISYDYEFTNLKRSYGHLDVPTAPAATVPACHLPPGCDAQPPTILPAAPDLPAIPRCDAWSRLARQSRKQR